MHTSIYHSINQNAVPTHQTQATFPKQKKVSFQATWSQFPLSLAWVVTIHKCQGLTLPEIVIDMAHAKGKFKPGVAYVAFSRVRTLEKLHITNYTQSQIHVSEHVEKEMKRLRENICHECQQIYFLMFQEVWNSHKYWKFPKKNRRYEKWHSSKCRHNIIEWNSFWT